MQDKYSQTHAELARRIRLMAAFNECDALIDFALERTIAAKGGQA